MLQKAVVDSAGTARCQSGQNDKRDPVYQQGEEQGAEDDAGHLKPEHPVLFRRPACKALEEVECHPDLERENWRAMVFQALGPVKQG